MSGSSSLPKIMLIDSNVYFAKRLGDALQKEGFDVVPCAQAAFALTMLEYDTPAAILCATNLREMNALEIARILHADSKNANLPIIAIGDGSQKALMEAFSRKEGFQTTQMLASADTSLSGSLSHHDLPDVIQMLGQARQTGALHINAADTDGIIFFDGGEITHAECGTFFGDEAVIRILISCKTAESGVYKFMYGTTAAQRTVLRSATDLMLDAMHEFDEAVRHSAEKEPS